MQYGSLGTTGLSISKLCLGTMSFGGDADEAIAREMISAALDSGINFFDSADVYNSGRSEEILGRALAGVRDDVVIATKAYFPSGPGRNDRGSSRFHLVRAVESSLQRLGTDRIDVFYLHRFDDNTALDDCLRTLDDLVSAGKILYPAASNFAAWQVAKALGLASQRGYVPLACIQPMYNLVKRQAEVELLPMAAAEGLGVMTYSPLAGGLLAGAYGSKRRPEKGRLVENAMYQTRYGEPAFYDVAERFVALAGRVGLHPATLAVGWVKQHSAVSAAIIGARNAEQLAPSLAAGDLELEAEVYAEVAALWPAPPPATDRNEEGAKSDYASQLVAPKAHL